MRYIFKGKELTYKKSIEIALQGDKDSTVLTFDIERKQDGIDLGDYAVQLLLKGDFMPEPKEDIITDLTGLTVKVGGSRISISWLVNSTQTYQQGTGTGQFRLVSASGAVWHSKTFDLNVEQSMSVDGTVEARAPSVIVDHTARLQQLEQKTDSEQGDFMLKGEAYTKDETYNKDEIDNLAEPIPALQEGYSDLANILDYDSGTHTSPKLQRVDHLESELDLDSGTGRLERLERAESRLGALNEALKPFFKNVCFNATNGHLTFVQENGNVITVDLPTELIVDTGYFDEASQQIILILANGNEIAIPISAVLEGLATKEYVLAQVAAAVPPTYKIGSFANFGIANDIINYRYTGNDPQNVMVTTDWCPSMKQLPLGTIRLAELCYYLAIEKKSLVPSTLKFIPDPATFKKLDFIISGDQLIGELHFNIIPDKTYTNRKSKLVTQAYTINNKYEQRVFNFERSSSFDEVSLVDLDLYVFGESEGSGDGLLGVIQGTATLEADKWSDNKQTIIFNGILKNSAVWVYPTNESHYAYVSAEIKTAEKQLANSITFICETEPNADIEVRIIAVIPAEISILPENAIESLADVALSGQFSDLLGIEDVPTVPISYAQIDNLFN